MGTKEEILEYLKENAPLWERESLRYALMDLAEKSDVGALASVFRIDEGGE